MVVFYLADGFEETEALAPLDILRRGGVNAVTCSITENKCVTGAHGIPLLADKVLEELDENEKMIVLPGGMPGTLNLSACEKLKARLIKAHERGAYLAAICAAPTVFAALGFLDGKRATCYPGMEKELSGAFYSQENVVSDGKIITSRGVGTALDFGFRLLEILTDRENARRVSESIVRRWEK